MVLEELLLSLKYNTIFKRFYFFILLTIKNTENTPIRFCRPENWTERQKQPLKKALGISQVIQDRLWC